MEQDVLSQAFTSFVNMGKTLVVTALWPVFAQLSIYLVINLMYFMLI